MGHKIKDERTGKLENHKHLGYPTDLQSGNIAEAKKKIEKRIRNLVKRKLDTRGQRKLNYLQGILAKI